MAIGVGRREWDADDGRLSDCHDARNDRSTPSSSDVSSSSLSIRSSPSSRGGDARRRPNEVIENAGDVALRRV